MDILPLTINGAWVAVAAGLTYLLQWAAGLDWGLAAIVTGPLIAGALEFVATLTRDTRKMGTP